MKPLRVLLACVPAVLVATSVLAGGQETARGEAVLVRMPESWLAATAAGTVKDG